MPQASAPVPKRRTRWVVSALGLFSAATMLWSTNVDAGSGDLLVIANRSNPASKVDVSELRTIFQTRKRTWPNGVKIEPVNLPEKAPQRQLFDKAVFGFDAETTLRYWIDRKVRGEARPPKKLGSPAAVMAYVTASPGGIGFIPEGALETGVKVLARVANGQVKAP